MPQPPQLAGSAIRFMQTPLQGSEPSAHTQRLTLQVCPAPQTVPQAPQLKASLSVRVQPPLQLVSPTLQLAMQAPFSHTSAASQGVLQAPQLS